MRRMIADNGKAVLLGGKVKAYISDYKGQFDTEANIFLKMLEADCGKFINEAPNVLERKRQLVERMDKKLGISRTFSVPLLDLLGFLLRGDTTKCMEQPGNDLNDTGEAAWERKDYEAVSWYQKAAEPYDKVKAVQWNRKAAEQGDADAQVMLDEFEDKG